MRVSGFRCACVAPNARSGRCHEALKALEQDLVANQKMHNHQLQVLGIPAVQKV